MSSFHLQIVTPDGLFFDGQAQKVRVRTIAGDVAILPKHIDYVTALGMGEAKIVLENGEARTAACIGGMLSVAKGEVRLVATTFEWAEEIDVARAERSEKRARRTLEKPDAGPDEIALAQARLKRALIRSAVGKKN